MRDSKQTRPARLTGTAHSSIGKIVRSLLSAAAISAIAFSAPATAAVVKSPAVVSPVATYKVLKSFKAFGGRPQAGLLEISDGVTSHLYGTARDEGGFGAVFRVSPTGDGPYTFTTLHTFNGTDGRELWGGLVKGADGYLYGMTCVGGQYDDGTVFKVSTNGTGFQTLHTFSGGTDGQAPVSALLLGADGNFYGTTTGGVGTDGTVFKIASNGLGFTTLHAFAGSDGRSPQSELIQIDGVLYGTTSAGGAYGNGTIFRISPDGTGFATVYSFFPADGTHPVGGLLRGTSGELYGVTPQGGTFGGGTIFKVGTNGSGFTVLHSFAGTGDGSSPYSALIRASDGNLYGTTDAGGGGYGTVFRIAENGTGYGVVHSFEGTDGNGPTGGLIQGADGDLYGTAGVGGGAGVGTVFRLALDGSVTQVLDAFTSGAEPVGALIRGADGRLYGTTEYGGFSDNGTIFAMDIDGKVTTRLHSFWGSNGSWPRGPLTQAPDGTLYGTTPEGGAAECGTVFSIAPDGSGFASIHSFNISDGCHPSAGLVRLADGSFYGTTDDGGGSSYGTVFKLYQAGESWLLETLHSFVSSSDGEQPGELTLGSDGRLYGTTYSGGPNGFGTVFSIATNGTGFEVLRSFSTADGVNPLGVLAEGAAGWFYGVTSGGGASGYGTIFKIYKDGSGFATLHSFLYDDGAYPLAGLVRDSDGNLYGTASDGGTGPHGTVFRLAANETDFTILHQFSGEPNDGRYSEGALLLADGTFYGTTEYGGWDDGGTVFRMRIVTAVPSVAISAGGPTTFCMGGDVVLTATPSGGSGSYVGYQWYEDDVPLDWETGPTYTASLSGVRVYTATVMDSLDAMSAKSEPVTVTVNPPPTATITPDGATSLCGGASVTLTASEGSSWLWSNAETTQSITVNTDGDYTVTVTDANGCSATSDAITVTTHPAPTAVVSGDATICARGSANIQVALTGTGPWGLLWSDGFMQTNIPSSPATRTVSPRTTTTYTVTAMGDTYCDGSGDGSATVTIADPPKAVLKGSATLCPGGSTDLTVELTGTAPWSITWSDGPTDSGISTSPFTRTVSPTEATIYSITTVSDAGCSPGSARGAARIRVSAPDATISTRSTVCASSTRNTASVSTAGKGATYSWSITNGTISSGQGTRSIQFTPGSSGYVDLQVTVTSADGCATTGPTTSVMIDTGC